MRRRLVSGASVDFHESAEDLVVELRKTSRSTRLFWVFALLVTIAAAGGGLLLVYSGRLAESVPSDAPTAVEPPETPAPDDRQEPSTAAVEPSEKPVAQTASSASASPATPPSSRPHTSKGAKKTKPARKEGEPPGELVIPDEPNF